MALGKNTKAKWVGGIRPYAEAIRMDENGQRWVCTFLAGSSISLHLAAQLLGVTVPTVYLWWHSGKIKQGKQVGRVKMADYDSVKAIATERGKCPKGRQKA